MRGVTTESRQDGRRGRRRRVGTVLGLAALAGAAAWAARDVPAALGGRLTGARAERAARSPQYRDGTFHNPAGTRNTIADPGRNLLWELLFGPQRRRPSSPVPLRRPADVGSPTSAAADADHAPADADHPAVDADHPAGAADHTAVDAGHAAGAAVSPTHSPAVSPAVSPTVSPAVERELNVVWYGHASALIEIEGHRVLVDPIWSERCSPSSVVGPRRLHAPPVALAELPPVDAILISHDHYDHLDMATVRGLREHQSAPFLVPLGVGAHLERWGVPAERVVELDWSQRHRIGGLEFVATAAQHFSGRGLRRDGTLWGSWVVSGAHRRVFYTGDSGYFDGYATIGAEHGPFDVTLMQVGAYDRAWPHIHMFPEEAVAAHLDLRGELLVPVHWGTFNLALHDWAEPVDRVWHEAKARGVRLAVPRPGERVVVDDPPPVEGWWQEIA